MAPFWQLMFFESSISCLFLVFAHLTTVCCIETHHSKVYVSLDNERSANSSPCIEEAASILSMQFNETAFNELGTPAALERISSLKTSNFFLSNDDLLLTISEKLSSKLQAAVGLLGNMRHFILNNSDIPSFTHPCHLNSLRPTQLKTVDGNFVVSSGGGPKYRWYGHNKDLKIQRQYFLSTLDLAIDEDCTLFNQVYLRNLFYRVYQPFPLEMIVIFDDLIANEIEFQQAIVVMRELLNTLRSDDRIALTTVSNQNFLNLTKCGAESGIFGNASTENSGIIMDYIFQIKKDNDAKLSSITTTILRHIEAKPNVEIILITNNTTRSSFIYDGLKNRSISFTAFYAYENTPENFTAFNLFHNRGKSIISDDLNALIYTAEQAISVFYLSLKRQAIEQIVSAMTPYWEPTTRDFVIPFILPCEDHGILGLDLFLSDLAEDVIFLKKTSVKRRVFIIDINGKIVMHSTYPRPELLSDKLKFIDISEVENSTGQIRQKLISKPSGNEKILDNNIVWVRVQALYIVGVISESNPLSTSERPSRSISDLLYHRIDLFPPENGVLCRHFKQVATIEKGTVYLSPSSFHSPFSYLHDIKDGKDTSFTTMQSYLAYLKDTTRLLSNPGLKPEIRNDVAILNPLLSYYKEQHLQSANLKYIVRRYAAMESGVLVTFPGSILDFDYEPARKAWFVSAFDNPERLIFTPPYLDIGGSGYIITVSYSLRISKQMSTIVLGMDVTMGFIYKFLIDTLPECMQPELKCFLMDDKGYLVSHPELIDPTNTGPVEQQHITHKESLIANDILNHKGFVKKQLCNSFADGTIQRFYEFNTSLSNVLSNVLSGDRCVHYEIVAIPGTNLFLGIVNSTCEAGAFCPCSMVDRVCLNCNRMEQNECECPCECQSALKENACSVKTNTDAPMCPRLPEKSNFKNNYYYALASSLKSCFDFKCEAYKTHQTCLGVLGCEWCQMDTDAETFLAVPLCVSQSSCFNGVLGAITPYGEGTYGHVTSDVSEILTSYSAVGPVAGCIVAVCLIIAIAIYCYRENSLNNNNVYPRAVTDNWPEYDVQLSNLGPDNDINGECSGHQDKLLPIDPATPVSPYKILTGYKRPNTTGDSDHGYSTMTPHEDSEHLAFALSEPINILNDTQNLSDDCSVDTSASSPHVKQSITTDGMTFVPCGKNILAQVTVHRHMEAL